MKAVPSTLVGTPSSHSAGVSSPPNRVGPISPPGVGDGRVETAETLEGGGDKRLLLRPLPRVETAVARETMARGG